MTKRGGGGQKLPILRRHSLWTTPYIINPSWCEIRSGMIELNFNTFSCSKKIFHKTSFWFNFEKKVGTEHFLSWPKWTCWLHYDQALFPPQFLPVNKDAVYFRLATVRYFLCPRPPGKVKLGSSLPLPI